MNELEMLRDFRSRAAEGHLTARDSAWRDLAVRIEAAGSPGRRPGKHRSRRGLALAGSGLAVAAAALAFMLVGGSGSRTEPAAAEALRQTAAVAADQPSTTNPGPGQFVFTRARLLNFETWVPGGPMNTNRPDAYAALVPSVRELWVSPEGEGRLRETQGSLEFLSAPERERWERAGSPPPNRYANSGVADVTVAAGSIEYLDVSALPTDPASLRSEVEAGQTPGLEDPGSSYTDGERTISSLWRILEQPNASPQLRAAAFAALAELPGTHLVEHATDPIGRSGEAIYRDSTELGIRSEFVFDPATSELLGQRVVLLDPELAPSPQDRLPVGGTISEVAYLESRVVDSSDATG